MLYKLSKISYFLMSKLKTKNCYQTRFQFLIKKSIKNKNKTIIKRPFNYHFRLPFHIHIFLPQPLLPSICTPYLKEIFLIRI